MYLPRAFAETDLAALDALVARDNFVTLVTVRDGMPTVSHLPVLYRARWRARRAATATGRGRTRRREHAGPALLIVHGPHAYVSPAWYPDKEASRARTDLELRGGAPATASCETFDDRASLAALVDALEPAARSRGRQRLALRTRARRPSQPAARHHRVPLRASTRIDLKFKLNQNHPAANRLPVARHLAAAAAAKPAAKSPR